MDDYKVYQLEGAAVIAARQTKEILDALGALTNRVTNLEEMIRETHSLTE